MKKLTMTQQRKTQNEKEFYNCFNSNYKLKNFYANNKPITRLHVPIHIIDLANYLPQSKNKSTQNTTH